VVKKLTAILIAALLLVGALALSASALTINNGPANETPLYTIFNNFLGASLTSNAQLVATYTTVLETLPGPTSTQNFVVDAYATFAAYTQDPGFYQKGVATPITPLGSPFPTTPGANTIVDLLSSAIAFSPTTDFGFADITSGGGTKYTELNLNSGNPSQSNGLIFQITPSQWIVAFEDGASNQPLGDMDYNDLVLRVAVTAPATQAPIPPSGLLLGSGILGLIGLRRWWRCN
jgi:hypothetical protein